MEKINNDTIKLNFIMIIIFPLLMKLLLKYKLSEQDVLLFIFYYVSQITIGSLLTCIISQNCDTYILLN